MASIIWVEDQLHWINKFSSILEQSDFDGKSNALLIYNFAEAAKQKIALIDKNTPPDVALLDARMNGNDQAGFSVSSALRKKWPDIPIIYLSEHSGTEIERDALEQFSAADFIAKHQNNVEQVLCWRIKAVLRQSALGQQAGSNASDSIVSGDLTIDLSSWNVYWKSVRLMNPSNRLRPLAPTPRKILRELVECSPRPLTAGQIAERIEADVDKFSYASYRQHIKTLRRAIDAAEAADGNFLKLCNKGHGIVTFGDEGAYFWNPPVTDRQ
ncbi:MAG: response regulator transcription factor [Gammaproteobacteria bacterium]|nr:response regulator transcription factor [Gammaproteobacteria bacterium]